MIDTTRRDGESEWDRTERLIIEALTEAGDWQTQLQVRKATGLPRSRAENFTLAMYQEGKIKRTLTPDHRTQSFRALAPGEVGRSLV